MRQWGRFDGGAGRCCGGCCSAGSPGPRGPWRGPGGGEVGAAEGPGGFTPPGTQTGASISLSPPMRRKSQALAALQSRFTVGAEIPSTSADSSTERPPK
jgi:hypothetical protein